MSHGYNNFMNNKDFHPGNFSNQRRIWEAEQKKTQEDKKQEELRQQYLKEQEIYRSKELLGKANPLDFMYEPPPGFVKDEEGKNEGGDGKLELKFDWQKPGRAAPREESSKDMPLRDKPFGVEVRNVKCIKCDKWGHINTDRECPLFGKAKSRTTEEEGTIAKPVSLGLDSVEDGLMFRQCVRDRVVDSSAGNQQILASDEETDIHDLLAGMGSKEKRKMLRKLARIQAKEGEGEHSKKTKHKKKSKKRSNEKFEKKKGSQRSDSDRHRVKQKKRKQSRRHSDSSDDSASDSESESDYEQEHQRRRKQARTQYDNSETERAKERSRNLKTKQSKHHYDSSGTSDEQEHQRRRKRERDDGRSRERNRTSDRERK